MTSELLLPLFADQPGCFGWWSGHKVPRRIFLVAVPPDGFSWGITEDMSKAKQFSSIQAAHEDYLSHVQWPEDYRAGLSTGRYFFIPI